MKNLRSVSLLWLLPLFAGTVLDAAPTGLDYDIVYVRQPRYGDNVLTTWPDASRPARAEPGSDLVLLLQDGSEEILVSGGNGAVGDPFVSFDGSWVYYTYFYDLRPGSLNDDRDFLPLLGSDIFRIHIDSRTIEQLTFGEFTPNTGAGVWDESNPLDPGQGFNSLGYGILNQGPAPLPGGRVIFTSNRRAYEPPKTFTSPSMQLYVMDEDGSNVTAVAPMTIGSALHPVPLRDGRVMFSSYESQALRDRRAWAIWTIYPDGRNFEPILSAFRPLQTFHFMTQMSDEDIVVEDYYTGSSNGFGTLYRFPVKPPLDEAPFYPAFVDENPEILRTFDSGVSALKVPFSPWGIHSITPFTNAEDTPAPIGAGGQRVGKVTHPSAAPDGDLLVVWTPGAANHGSDSPEPLYYDAGIYVVPGGEETWDPAELTLIKNDPNYNESWPRAVVSYRDVHGISEPVEIPWLPNDGSQHAELPAGTPFGLIGASSLYKRESFPGWVDPAQDTFDGLDSFNSADSLQSSNWRTQGADAGKYDNSDIWALRVVAMEPNTHRSYGPVQGRQFASFANERLRILGEIPVRKPDGAGGEILDLEGNPDTSFLVKIPADTPFTFQTLDRDGMLLNMAQTWHQLRPGEMLTCGGCHSHSQTPLEFEWTEAAKPEYEVFDLLAETPLLTKDAAGNPDLDIQAIPLADVEFYRDIRPILQRSCVSCHTGNDPNPPGELVLDDLALYDGLPGDYVRLAADESAQFGYPAVIADGQWHQHNASRYVRQFQSRRSLLIWKLFGARTDGWSNADHPTESVPGDAASLPAGADPNQADIDYTGQRMPPPGGGAERLSDDERMTFVRWIDLGAPIDLEPTRGWFLDDLRPTIALSTPRPGRNQGALSAFRIGLVDANSGIDLGTLSVKSNVPLAGRPALAELADLAVEIDQGIYEIDLSGPMAEGSGRHVFVEVADFQGNVTRVDRRFSVVDSSGVYHRVAVITDGTGQGSVVSTPAGIDCGLDCEDDFLEGTVVTLSATADPGSVFLAWSGDSDCADGSVSVDAATDCVAEFERLPVLSAGLTGVGSGAVSSDPQGIDCGSDCTESFGFGTLVTMSALPEPGSLFVGWSGDSDCLDGIVTMDSDLLCVAEFTPEHSLSISLTRLGSGSVTSSPGAINCEPDCSEGFALGTVVTLTALPDEGSVFSGWSGTADCNDGVVTVTTDLACVAGFALQPILSITPGGAGSGLVTSEPAGIDCGTDCTEAYLSGTAVQLTATPDPGSVFDQWGGNADCLDGLVTMDGDLDCTANFITGQNILTVAKTGTGTGTVRSNPAGVSCGSICQKAFDVGTQVTLIPVAGANSTFTGWSGDADCLDGIVTMNIGVSCVGTFDTNPMDQFLLMLNKGGSGTGLVTSSPAGIDCGVDCQENFTDGTVVSLTAEADPGHAFVAWSGSTDCADGVVTVNRDLTCQALFVEQPVLTVTKGGAGDGTVTSNPAGISCGADCDESYSAGTQVVLTVTPDPGSFFDHWEGPSDCADGTVTLDASLDCAAIFVQRELYVRSSGTGSGTITSSPIGISCPGDCIADFPDGSSVTLTVTPTAGSLFEGWVGEADCLDGVVTMAADLICTATFSQPTLSVQKQGSGAGTITSAPAGIDCGGSCTAEYAAGTSVTLTAVPSSGSVFTGWAGPPDCADGIVSMAGTVVCIAEFDIPTLTVETFGPGSGTVTSSPAGIDCGTQCAFDRPAGTVVTLTAVPDSGSGFVGWVGATDCVDGVVTLDADVTCRARFD